MVWLEDPCEMFMAGWIIKAGCLDGDSQAISRGLVERADIDRASPGGRLVSVLGIFFAP